MEMVSGDLRQKTGRVGRPGNVTITLEQSGNKKIGLKKKTKQIFSMGKGRAMKFKV